MMPIFPLASFNGGGYKLIKVTVPTYQKLHIVVFPQQAKNELVQRPIQLQLVINSTVSKETDGIILQHYNHLFFLFCLLIG